MLYADHMKKMLFPVLFLFPFSLYAAICKSVDADGVVTYSDVPAGQCETIVTLPAYSRYAPRDMSALPGNAEKPSNSRFLYEFINITLPVDGSVMRDNTGTVAFAAESEPPMLRSHRLRIRVNDKEVEPLFDSLNGIVLQDVDRGKNVVRAEILDTDGIVLQKSAPISFMLHRASKLNPNSPLNKQNQNASGGGANAAVGSGAGSSGSSPPFRANY